MKPVRIALVGFGNVGRRFVELLGGPYGRILKAHGVKPLVTGIATARHGITVDRRGLSLARVLAQVRRGDSLAALHRGSRVTSCAEFVRQVPADVLIEVSPLSPRDGEPAATYVRLALSRGIHVVTANKGPVAFAWRRLQALARRRGRLFLHEGAVMDGTPLFNLAKRCLSGARIIGFRGALNSTTTRILARMEQGASAEEALREAQAAGIVEADPRNDLDGWDAAVKACSLANALMGTSVRPPEVRRQGIGQVEPEDVRRALRAGRRIRLIARAKRVGRRIEVSVAPEPIPIDDLLVSSGCDGVVVLETDLMGEIGIWEGKGGIEQTTYALLCDLLAVVDSRRSAAGSRSGSAIRPGKAGD